MLYSGVVMMVVPFSRTLIRYGKAKKNKQKQVVTKSKYEVHKSLVYMHQQELVELLDPYENK